MKNQEKIVVKLDELPPRAEKLSHEKITSIFGGCKDPFDACLKSSDCCEGNCVVTADNPRCSM